jgi:hypothetical protein
MNNLVANNTVLQAPDGRWALLMSDGSSGNTLINNIFLNENPLHGSIAVESDSKPALSDYNIVEDHFQIDGVDTSFAAWPVFTGQDAHDLFATPEALFVDPATNDYDLRPGSPALGAGTPQLAPAVDLYQHPRQPGVDVGAIESGPTAPQVQFGWANYVGYQTGGLAVIDVVRSGDTESPLTVHFATADGTALGGIDYVPVSDDLTFLPGQVTKTEVVQLINPAKLQPIKTLSLTLSDPSGATQLGPQASATLSLLSDSNVTPGALSFTQPSVTVNDNDGLATVTVQRAGGSDGTVTVDYSTGVFTPPPKPNWNQYHTLSLYPVNNDEVATAGDDYTPVSGTLTFGPGETSKSFTVPIANDPWFEADEGFMVNLSHPTGGATLDAQASAEVRIHTDKVKQPGQFQFEAANYSVVAGTADFAFTVTRTGGCNVGASVMLYQGGGSVADPSLGSAWAGNDYAGVPSELDFAPGEVSKTIHISVVNHGYVVGDKAFTVELYSPTNDATLGVVASTVVKIVDSNSDFEFQSPAAGNNFVANETDGFAQITVLRRGSTLMPASVTIQTVDWGSAKAGVNYLPVSMTLQFMPGETSKIVQVPVLDDHVVTGTLDVGIAMSNAVGAKQNSGTWALQILNTDVAANPGQIALDASSYSVMKNGGALVVTVLRTGGSDGTVTVHYSTSDGAPGCSWSQFAYGGAQYVSQHGTLTFLPGETSKTITIPIIYNSNVSVDKMFTITLSSPAGGATLGPNTKAVATIKESDSAYLFQTSTITTNEGASYAVITIVRQGNTAGAGSVDLGLTGYTAKPGTNFVMPNNWTVNFAAGQSVQTFKIALLDDHVKTSTMWIGLTLKNAVGGKLGSSQWANLYVQDID